MSGQVSGRIGSLLCHPEHFHQRKTSLDRVTIAIGPWVPEDTVSPTILGGSRHESIRFARFFVEILLRLAIMAR